MAAFDDIRQIKSTHVWELMQRANVNGVAIGYKIVNGRRTSDLTLSVLVRQKVAVEALSPQDLVPRNLDGLPTDVVQVGDIRASQLRTDRFRPAPGGVSIGHFRVSAGTLGVVVRDRASGDRLVLSNNHVLANSNDAQPGDPIIQPGGADGGVVGRDTIAVLERFCPIEFNSSDGGSCGVAGAYAGIGNALAQLLGSRHRVSVLQVNPQATNLVDAAVARPLNDEEILNQILEIGVISGTRAAELGMPVRKSGRTTALTTGQITAVDATVSVNYGGNNVATFEDQLIAGPISQGGDSGSLVVAGDSQDAVGLLFAGSDQTTIFSPIQAVFDCLDVVIA